MRGRGPSTPGLPVIEDLVDAEPPPPPRIPFAQLTPDEQAAITVPWAETVLPAVERLIQALDDLDDANREWRAGLHARIAALPPGDWIVFPKAGKAAGAKNRDGREPPRDMAAEDMLTIGDGLVLARREYFSEDRQTLYTRALGGKLGRK